MKLRLYGYWRSSCTWRVRIGLGLKGLAFEHAIVNLLANEHWSEAHGARSPLHQVPVLEVEGRGGRGGVEQVPAALHGVGPDPSRPGHHHRVAGTAKVAGHLLAPLERRVVGVRPGGGEVRRGVLVAERFDAAVPLDEREDFLGRRDDRLAEILQVGEGAFAWCGRRSAGDLDDDQIVTQRLVVQ